MAETAIEEQISPHWQRECWNGFLVFLATQSYSEHTIQAGIPFLVTGSETANSGGWTTDSSLFSVSESDDEDTPDEETFKFEDGKKRLYLKAVIALLSNATNAAAAREVGISTRQLSRWRQDKEFQDLYQRTKQELYQAAMTGMKSVLVKAGIVGAKTLQRIAEDKTAADTAQVQAAKALTQLALQIEDIETLAADVAALKAGRE